LTEVEEMHLLTQNLKLRLEIEKKHLLSQLTLLMQMMKTLVSLKKRLRNSFDKEMRKRIRILLLKTG
jgi:RNAse (barnase) inhibitor barstar